MERTLLDFTWSANGPGLRQDGYTTGSLTPHLTHAGPYASASSTQLSYTGWNGFAANQDWTLMFRIEFPSSLETNKYFMYHHTSGVNQCGCTLVTGLHSY